MTTKHDALTFLQQHKLAVLSTLSAEGEPDGAAIYYVCTDATSIYFLTRKESQKFKDLTVNANAALTIVDDEAQQTIQANGTVEEVSIGEEHDEAVRLLAQPSNDDKSWGPPVSKLQTGEITLCRFTARRMRYSDFRSASLHSGAHIIEVV